MPGYKIKRLREAYYMPFNVARNLERINMDISEACRASGQNPDEIIIVGVTKYFGPEAIVAAVQAGIRHIGENRPIDVQEKFPIADAKIAETLGPGKHYTRHMIGHLQRNKVRVALEMFDLVQTLDSLQLAQVIQAEAGKLGIEKVECLIELKVSEEESKTGLDVSLVDELVESIRPLDRIAIRGIMGMPPYFQSPEDARPYFRKLHETFVRLKSASDAGVRMDYLSMGMSHDFPIAVEEGANMVRIGQALFE